MPELGRNAPCPCGSGLKYKRCCLRRGGEMAQDAEHAERVWGAMQSWTLKRFGDEIGAALKELMEDRGVGSERRPAGDEDLSLALCWLLIDRELLDGGTPAQLFALLPDLSASDREVASRIAASRLSLHRVLDTEPGAWIELENVISGATVRVSSPNVSRAAVRWDVLLCRVMAGGPMPSLWGAAGFYEPAEEPELLSELRRIGREHGLDDDRASLEAALQVGARSLVCFAPASRRAGVLPFTLEGDPAVAATATWCVRDPRAALGALRGAPELAWDGETEDGEGEMFSWLAPRRALIARRPWLPLGAICLESGPVDVDEHGELIELEDVTCLGTFELRGDRLAFFGLSKTRLDAAVDLIERRLGSLARDARRRVEPLPSGSGEADSPAATRPMHEQSRIGEDAAAIPDPRLGRLLYRRWIDDPHQALAGLSPREAVARQEHRPAVERLLRSLEHGSARERHDGRPGPEVSWVRSELGLDAPLAA